VAEDWTSCVDDLLIGRLERCTLCQAAPIVYGHIWVPDDGTPMPPVAVVLCKDCRAQGDAVYVLRLQALFQERYRKDSA